LRDGLLERQALVGLTLIGTYVQRLELADTPQENRRHELLKLYSEFVNANVAPFTMRWGDPWGSSWSDTDGLYDQLLSAVRKVDKGLKKRKRKQNQERDAQIAETAIKANRTLVTEDPGLRCVVEAYGGRAISIFELRS
jgi:hypothetical protein